MFSPLFFLSFIFAASSISQNTGSAAWLIPLLLFAIVVSFAAEKWLPYEKAWNTPQGDFGRDIVHAIVNEGSLALTVAFIPIMTAIVPHFSIGNAKNLIDGYFSPSPSKPGGKSEELKRAQRECLANLQKQLQYVQSVTESQFFSKTQ
ncbi:hypothetical protein HHX48_17370 [Salinimonas sp. HHU 13199]|nr:hypothetical protein [Salinimonas profundi]MBD3587512.1 hypothetical protein [Salinimonas profundi]